MTNNIKIWACRLFKRPYGTSTGTVSMGDLLYRTVPSTPRLQRDLPITESAIR